jgi:hypothetical protein
MWFQLKIIWSTIYEPLSVMVGALLRKSTFYRKLGSEQEGECDNKYWVG